MTLVTKGLLGPFLLTSGLGVSLPEITLSGPSSGAIYKSSQFNISFSYPYTGVIIPSDSPSMGYFYPDFLEPKNSSDTLSFYYTPSLLGNVNISLLLYPSVTLIGSPVSFLVIPREATSVVLTGPPPTDYLEGIQGYIGVEIPGFTISPNGFFTGTITMIANEAYFGMPGGGTFNPSTLVFSNSNIPQTFTYTPNSIGRKIITILPNSQVTISNGLSVIVTS